MAKEKDLSVLIKELSDLIKFVSVNWESSRRNETWTRRNLIEELLKGLGWNTATDLSYEDHPNGSEGWLDYIVDCHPKIGIEAKALYVIPPQNDNDPQIKKALEQCKERGASYMIWTNGDCWLFFSLALPNAPFYQVLLSEIGEIPSNEYKLRIINKKLFTINPKHFDEAIRENWQITAVPAAWKMLLQEHPDEILRLVQERLPAELDVEGGEIKKFSEKILKFVETFKPDIGRRIKPKPATFPDVWKELLDPMESKYDNVRERFRNNSNYRKLANHIINENCKPWPKKATYMILGFEKSDTDKRKGASMLMSDFRKFQFIEEEDGKYKRGEGVDYLKKLLE